MPIFFLPDWARVDIGEAFAIFSRRDVKSLARGDSRVVIAVFAGPRGSAVISVRCVEFITTVCAAKRAQNANAKDGSGAQEIAPFIAARGVEPNTRDSLIANISASAYKRRIRFE